MWRLKIEGLGQKVIDFFVAVHELFRLFLSTVKSLTSL